MHLFGNSLGGAVATRVAAARPDLVRTLTLVSPALPELPPQRTAVPTALLAVPGVAALFTRLTQDWSRGAAHPGAAGALLRRPRRGSRRRASRDAVDGDTSGGCELPYFWDAMARSARGIVDAYTLGGQHGLWRQAERVLAPTLLVYGGRDQLVSLPDGAPGGRGLPRLAAADAARRRARGDDGVPGGGGPGLP